jgi:antitoxin (DNA-binding transcriptional repressor) of toxin-antitoxin stability system
MTLNPIPSHPSSLCYVLKLHRDSRPTQRQISGLLEHVATGQSISFDDAGGLVAALLAHAATDAAQSCHHAREEPL